MKRLTVTLALVAISLVSCKKETNKVESANDSVTATDTTATAPSTPEQPMDSVAMQKAWEAYSTPGDVHKLLTSEVGKWDVTMTFWMTPGAPPQSDKASAEIKMIMGGRYQKTVFTGSMMGMSWEGESTVAYNNKSEQITSTFIDNSGTGIMVATGPYNIAKKAFELKGESIDPMTGKTIKFREIYSFIDDNTRKLEIFDTKDGQSEYKSLEIVLKRK